MNVLIVNPVNPRKRHISAVRAWRFSQEFASLGHRVVLLTAPLAGEALQPVEDIVRHDWKKPYVLPCADEVAAVLNGGIRTKRFGKLSTLVNLIWRGGEAGGWVRNALLAIERIKTIFEPDIVWCTFGKMEAVFAARGVAASNGCPWVLDLKDNWELFVPRGLRRLMVWRTRGWAAVTANAEFTADKARRWQHALPTVIYSGVDDVFYRSTTVAASLPIEFRINLVGSLYHREQLQVLLQGIRRWTEGIGKQASAEIELCYMGTDNSILVEALKQNPIGMRVRQLGYVDVAELALNCQHAAVNAYIVHSGGFHHKLLELLACGRPLLVIPHEDVESRNLVRLSGGQLLEAVDESTVEIGLAEIYRDWNNGVSGGMLMMPERRYTWRSQAMKLEAVLSEVFYTNQRKR